MKLLLIHGAGASSVSWRTFETLVGHPCDVFSYDVNRPFEHILTECVKKIDAVLARCLVGHSFGGIIAWHAANIHDMIACGISVAAPWGGSVYADVMEAATLGWLPSRFFQNVGRSSHHSVIPRTQPSRVPWMNVVTTRGIIGSVENDGVLTVPNQDSLYRGDNVLRVPVKHNHSEVLHTDELAMTASSFVRQVAKGLRRV